MSFSGFLFVPATKLPQSATEFVCCLYTTTARKAYQDVFAFWKDADNDIPGLIEADFVAAEFCSGCERHFFNAAVQFRITVGGAAFVSPMSVPMRKR